MSPLELGQEYKEFYGGKRVLVTGGTGLIGRQVLSLLVELGSDVTSVSLDDLAPVSKVRYIQADLTDFEKCMGVISLYADYVIHLAGIKGSVVVTEERPASFFVPLLRMNTNVLEASRQRGIKHLIYTSSIGAYPSAEVFVEDLDDDYRRPPMDMFPGWAKRVAELQIRAYYQEHNLIWSIVRPCNVYGPGDNFDPASAMVIPSLISKIYDNIYLNGPIVEVWGDGLAIRDFAYSRDVAMGILQVLRFGTCSHYVNLGSGVGTSIKKLVKTFAEFLDFEYRFDTSKASGFPKRVMNISLAKSVYDYNPVTTLRKGLEETWNWYVDHREESAYRHSYF